MHRQRIRVRSRATTATAFTCIRYMVSIFFIIFFKKISTPKLLNLYLPFPKRPYLTSKNYNIYKKALACLLEWRLKTRLWKNVLKKTPFKSIIDPFRSQGRDLMPIRVLTLLYLHPLSMFFLYFLRKLIAVYTCMIRQKSTQSKAVGLKKYAFF